MKRITVLGVGTMGHGIAHAAIAGGFDTRMYDVSDEALGKGRGAIEQIVRKGVELGKLPAADADGMLARLSTTASLAEALQDAELVVEAAPEKIDLKLALFAQIEAHAPAAAIIGSNTSALSITELDYYRRRRFCIRLRRRYQCHTGAGP